MAGARPRRCAVKGHAPGPRLGMEEGYRGTAAGISVEDIRLTQINPAAYRLNSSSMLQSWRSASQSRRDQRAT